MCRFGGFFGEVYFVVWDIGVGIVVDKLGYIFEVFLQEDSLMMCRFGGIGFGFIILL